MNPYWSYALTTVGVFGLFLAGRKSYWGWAVGLGAQGLWIAYAYATSQPGFYISALAYGGVYAWNLVKWRRTAREEVQYDFYDDIAQPGVHPGPDSPVEVFPQRCVGTISGRCRIELEGKDSPEGAAYDGDPDNINPL